MQSHWQHEYNGSCCLVSYFTGTSRPIFLDKRSQQFIDGLWKQVSTILFTRFIKEEPERVMCQ
jgi:hypothetical protein